MKRNYELELIKASFQKKSAKDEIFESVPANEPIMEAVKVSFVYDDQSNVIAVISDGWKVDVL